MDYKKIEKQQKIYSKIKEFDQLIISIEKLANTVENEKAKLKLSLSIQEPKKEKVIDEDDDNSLSSGLYRMVFNPYSYECGDKKQDYKKIKLDIADIFAYEVLGLVVKRVHEEREKLIKKLERIK